MPKGGLLVNTARKEVINEAELGFNCWKSGDLKYVTDIMPAANETLLLDSQDVISPHRRRWVHRLQSANINAGTAACQIVGFLKDLLEKFRVNK